MEEFVVVYHILAVGMNQDTVAAVVLVQVTGPRATEELLVVVMRARKKLLLQTQLPLRGTRMYVQTIPNL